MREFNIHLFAEQIENISTPKIPDETHFWLVRTKGGCFYQEFVNEDFVALGWNRIDQKTSFSKETLDVLKDEMKEIYDEKRPGNPINKCKRFIEEVSAGDYILIPNEGSSMFAICKAGEYYEENYSSDFELEQIAKLDSGEPDIKCPYKKRRRVQVLLQISAKRLGLKLIKATSSYHGISSLDEYAEDILNCVYNCYEYKGDIVYTINIAKQSQIKAREFSRLMYSITEMFCEIVTDEDAVSVKMSLSSPGRVIVKLQSGFRIIKKSAPVFLILYFLAFGGSGFGFEFNGAVDDIIEAVKAVRMMNIEVEKAEADLEGQRLDNYKKMVDLMVACNDSDLDIEKIQTQMVILNELSGTLRFENNEQFAIEEPEEVPEEESEETDEETTDSTEE